MKEKIIPFYFIDYRHRVKRINKYDINDMKQKQI